MKQEVALRLTPEQASREESFKNIAARKMKLSPGKITGLRVVRRSIDARQSQVMVQVHLGMIVAG